MNCDSESIHTPSKCDYLVSENTWWSCDGPKWTDRWHLSGMVLNFTLSELNTDDFAWRQHAAVSLSPYGFEHAHKLLSVSDEMPPTPHSGSDMGLRCTSSKTAADGEYSGSTSHCDGHLWDSTEWQLFLSTCPVTVQSAPDQGSDLEGGLAGGLARKA